MHINTTIKTAFEKHINNVNLRVGHHIIPIGVKKTRSCACKLKFLLLWLVNLELFVFFFFFLLFEKNGSVGRCETKPFIEVARSPSDGASISHTSPWSQPFAE